jgi:hypothetical protein
MLGFYVQRYVVFTGTSTLLKDRSLRSRLGKQHCASY